MATIKHITHSFFLLIIAAMVSLGVLGCQLKSSSTLYSQFNYNTLSPIHLNVAHIYIHEPYKPPFTPPNVEHLFPVKPYEAIRALVEDRFYPSGKTGELHVTIKDASVIKREVPEKIREGNTNEYYKGRLEVTFAIHYRKDRPPRVTFTTYVDRLSEFPENLGLFARQSAYNDFVYEMIKDLNVEIDNGVKEYFEDYQVKP